MPELIRSLPTQQIPTNFEKNANHALAGLGGLGRSDDQWTARYGAATIVFISRSQAKVKQLSDCDVNSGIFACDICEKSALEWVFEECGAYKIPPICWDIQAAMVLEMRYGFLELEIARL